MCLISTSKDPVVADKDIPVWKIVCTDGEKWVGPCLYDDFGYPFNVVNTAKAIPPGDPVEYLGTGHYAVKSGHFHTFAQKTSALYRFDNMHNSHYQKKGLLRVLPPKCCIKFSNGCSLQGNNTKGNRILQR